MGSACKHVLNAKGIKKAEDFSVPSKDSDSSSTKRSLDSLNSYPLLLRPELIFGDS